MMKVDDNSRHAPGEPKRTPKLPLHWQDDYATIYDSDGIVVAVLGNTPLQPFDWQETGRELVRAVNSHGELLEALRAALQDITGPITSVGIRIRFSTLEKVRAAIANAERKE